MIGIMQGRLLPPIDNQLQRFPGSNWKTEFEIANRIGLEHIEWIYGEDEFGTNPLDGSINEILLVSSRYNVVVRSVCADIFVNRPLHKCNEGEQYERLNLLRRLIRACYFLNVGNLVIPFVDNSAIADTKELKAVAELLKDVVTEAEVQGIYVCLETNLPPDDFQKLLELLPSVLVNYDSGNSASLGYNTHQEWQAYGERIGNVHIKDRKHGGSSVPLGEGNVDWIAFSECMVNYKHDITLQVARDKSGSEAEWAMGNIDFLRGYKIV